MSTTTAAGGRGEQVIQLFELGAVIATDALRATVVPATAAELLRRHRLNDWGDVGEFDAGENDAAVMEGGRIVSAYQVSEAVRVLIITEANRSATTLMLSEEY